MKIQIDKSKKTPLYRQIAEQIQAQIISGEIPDGFQFPSERQLADTEEAPLPSGRKNIRSAERITAKNPCGSICSAII